jgi:hypothetical protein
MARKGLIAWAVLGLLGLIFQATLFFKDSLAAHHPKWRPELEYFCKWMGCQIEPLQLADAVVIDHAAIDRLAQSDGNLEALNADQALGASPAVLPQWRFQITLRNTQNLSVAMPWIELTLTDAQDQAVMRQVLSPSVLDAPKVLKAGETWSQDLTLGLANPQIGFLGYRLLTFYP